MGLRLTIRRAAWLERVHAIAAEFPGLIPVVKGNGYGFGRGTLMPIASEVSDTIAVGTVYEATDVPSGRIALCLTPQLGPLPPALADDAVLTVGSIEHVEALREQGRTGSVAIKLRSSMRRYGVDMDRFEELVDAVSAAGLVVRMFAIHLPLAGTARDHVVEIERWLPRLDPVVPVSVSHVDAAAYRELRTAHPQRQFTIRLGTHLWHGDKSMLHLSADVVDVHPVRAGTKAGYFATDICADGFIVLAGAGSAHGVQPLEDGRSPFHFARRRLPLVEPPHMHMSMLLVSDGEACPRVGDRVDVQRPLTMTIVDELDWVDG